jgi:phospholipase C
MAGHNGGFVADFVKTHPASSAEDRQFVMGYYPLDFLPALHRLAREFTICDRWFSSLPGPTWPNRFFAMTGTSNGKVNMPEDGEHNADIEGFFQQDQPTLFDRLSEKHISWKIYYHDVPLSLCLVNQRKPENAARHFHVDHFLADAQGPEADFPAFCFIEPDYSGAEENDDHPPHDVMKAQKLLADVYNVIRANNELWKSALLVVVYDEHGGFYDHVEPPPAAPPSPPQANWEYSFDRLGIRVPALLISPWAERRVDSTEFDHTSVLRYLIAKWGLGPLGDRAGRANCIGPLLRAAAPRADTVEAITLSPDQLKPPRPDLEEEAAAYISSHQKALARVGRRLQWELLREAPLTYAWGYYLFEVLLHALSGLGNRWVFQRAHEQAEASVHQFLTRRREQAITVLAPVIRQPEVSPERRRFAAETLGCAARKPFHRDPDPVKAAMEWLESRHS